ncbi:hypothetical protein ES703_64286 [subsurface metagenome]
MPTVQPSVNLEELIGRDIRFVDKLDEPVGYLVAISEPPAPHPPAAPTWERSDTQIFNILEAPFPDHTFIHDCVKVL